MSACKCAGIRALDTLREISILKKHKMKTDQQFFGLSFLHANSHIMLLDDL